MMKTDDIFKFSVNAKCVLQVIEDAGYEAWFVGGCVRDALLKRNIHDIDIASNAPWQEVSRICKVSGMQVYETGTKHGTVTVVASDSTNNTPEAFEITTYRTDAKTSSDARHPDSVTFVSSIEEDLARRDFTINAMAYHPTRGLLDIYGGEKDIETKTIRVVGCPENRFKEDALRILRGCRFMSELGFSIEKETFDAMVSHKYLLSKISAERITYELDRFLLGEYAGNALMKCVDILEFVLPELVAMKGCEQNTKYHCYDVFEHTAHAVDEAPFERLPRWAALCHDMGKPAAKFKDPDGTDHFYGHAHISAMLAHGIASRLLMSQKFTSDLTMIVQHHSDDIEPSKKAVSRKLSRMGADEQLFRSYLSLKRADILAHAPEYRSQAQVIDDILDTFEHILKEDNAFSLKQLAIDGNDLIDLGIEKGPHIGEILQAALDAVIDDVVENDHDALMQYVQTNLIQQD